MRDGKVTFAEAMMKVQIELVLGHAAPHPPELTDRRIHSTQRLHDPGAARIIRVRHLVVV